MSRIIGVRTWIGEQAIFIKNYFSSLSKTQKIVSVVALTIFLGYSTYRFIKYLNGKKIELIKKKSLPPVLPISEDLSKEKVNKETKKNLISFSVPKEPKSETKAPKAPKESKNVPIKTFEPKTLEKLNLATAPSGNPVIASVPQETLHTLPLKEPVVKPTPVFVDQIPAPNSEVAPVPIVPVANSEAKIMSDELTAYLVKELNLMLATQGSRQNSRESNTNMSVVDSVLNVQVSVPKRAVQNNAYLDLQPIFSQQSEASEARLREELADLEDVVRVIDTPPNDSPNIVTQDEEKDPLRFEVLPRSNLNKPIAVPFQQVERNDDPHFTGILKTNLIERHIKDGKLYKIVTPEMVEEGEFDEKNELHGDGTVLKNDKKFKGNFHHGVPTKLTVYLKNNNGEFSEDNKEVREGIFDENFELITLT